MDTFEELDDLLSSFGLSHQSNTCNSVAIRNESENEVIEAPDISIESRLDIYFTAGLVLDSVNADNQGNADTYQNSEDPQSGIDNLKHIYDSGCKCTKTDSVIYPFL
ncbi:uncharacterized protein LOC132724950 [Ruditapes philippinarum]|uniref:uncharacterized protein LOC132724950 n=1 Tax=Ruditapes philippinarum TaxID=129788 RepID=UPI00295ADD29|nr:uncharacterized protein LOC132724950 [Ruditapes philippinarum]